MLSSHLNLQVTNRWKTKPIDRQETFLKCRHILLGYLINLLYIVQKPALWLTTFMLSICQQLVHCIPSLGNSNALLCAY